jgi:hypothetical protein
MERGKKETATMCSYKKRLSQKSGRAYYSEFAGIWAEIGGTVRTEIEQVRSRTQRLAIGDVLTIIDGHGLPFKPTVLALESDRVLKGGTYDVLQRNGLNLKKMRAELLAQRQQVLS